jgi:2-phospho-L-lactate/phosphoenolpyruvate guanylyltransferase
MPGRSGAGHNGWQDGPVGDAGWLLVVPAKRLGTAKSRLRGAVPDGAHAPLAAALLRDTLTAALACADVLVVTGDPAAAAVARSAGAAVTADPGGGLNAALRHGTRDDRRPRAALTGDLPGLRTIELSAALAAATAAGVRSFVADAAGTGTVLLCAPAGVPLDPRFGAGSAAAHAASGARALTGDWPGLRRDVDTAADLRAALELGVAAHTRALLRGLASADPAA